MADWYCANCGHELAQDGRFCPNCGSPVHEVAHVPTPEADVPVPPPQQAGGAVPSQQETGAASPETRSGRARFHGVVSWFSNLSGTRKVGAILGASVPIVGGLVGIATGLNQLYEKATYEEPTTQLAFVDVGFLKKPTEQDYPLDIKLRNTGKGSAFIKQADLRVEKIWTLTPPYLSRDEQCAFAGVTHKYRMRLPTSGAPYVRTVRLSQEVKSGGVDRFTIGFDYDNRRQVYEKDYVFLATLSLVYDEDDKQVSKDMLFASSQLGCDLYYKPGKGRVLREGLDESDAARLASQNQQALQEIKQKNVVKSDYVQRLIQTGERPDVASTSASSTATASASAQPEQAKHGTSGDRNRVPVYDMGEKIRGGDIAYTVTEAQLADSLKGNTCRVQSHPQDAAGPQSTKNAIAVETVFTNSSDERIGFRDLGLHVYDRTGARYGPENMFGGICDEKDIFQLKWLDPGVTQEAQVYYFVPLDASGFELEVTYESLPSEVARVRLGF